MNPYNISEEIRNWSHNAEEVYQRLQDDESRFLFESRIRYMFDPQKKMWSQLMRDRYDDWIPPLELQGKNHILLYGNGDDGKETFRLLEAWGINVECFCNSFVPYDNTNDVLGKPILNIQKAVETYPDGFYVISSSLFGKHMYETLIRFGIGEDQIFMPLSGIPVAGRGTQYFDIFEPKEQEVFIDGGAYDGYTTKEFFKWAGKGNHHAYVFEPIKSQFDIIDQELSNNPNCRLYCAALWNCDENLCFFEDGPGSTLDTLNNGDNMVKGVSIDTLLLDKKITFIKLDVEGAEKAALEGACETIRRDKPRLAVCVYHKNNDVVELGTIILSMVPEYKLYLRHYASNNWETVLYATV